MPATAKLYETDPYVQTFTATVLVCTPAGEQFAVQLDRTAFYPEGGGQPCDTGALGTALVTDVQEHGGVITHTVSAALPVGQTVEGRIDWARRRDHMEQHTGEHILSGTLHRLFGAENVGFHIGSPAVRMDMSVPLTAGQLAEAEAQANAVIRADAPVRCWYPAPEDLAKLTYRSKKEIDGAVRLVDAGGADLCACCGTHVSTTGQVGAIKILSAQSYKGGTRLAVVCGERAHQSIAAAWQDAAAVGTLLSSAPGRLLPAVQNLQTAEAALKQRLAAIEKEMAELRDSFNSKKAQWENEKNAINKVQSLRADVETTKAEIEKATRNGDYAKAGQLQYGKLPDLQRQLEAEEKIAADKKEQSLLRDRVTAEEISRIVARWTGIPVEKLVEGEREKLLRLPEVLHQRVIGQDEAVQKVSDAILRSRAGIANPNRPIGSFLFLGPTGVGKTELAKALAQALFDDEKNMVRIDMTEYMEKFSVSRLIGAPPGYVGYEEGGQLTEAVRRHPYSVVLFDEVEKAHPDVFNILLQVLDDGRITDSQGRTVDFKNTIIILTSNLGSDIILEDLEKNRANGKNELSAEARDKIDLLLKRQFRPEFLNRLDDIVYYKSLTKDEIGGIVDLMLADLRSRLADKQLKLVVTDAAKSVIVDDGYDPIYGARPLKRYIQANVETMIAKEIIGGNHVPGDTLTVDAENGKLVLR